jgi:hypothetical protein
MSTGRLRRNLLMFMPLLLATVSRGEVFRQTPSEVPFQSLDEALDHVAKDPMGVFWG